MHTPIMLNVHIVTLFPEFFSSPLACGLIARAQEKGLITFSLHNPRSYSTLRHQHVDDSPYGGGPGMVMQAEPVLAALRALPRPGRILYLTPQGRPFTQKLAAELAREEHLTFLCTRYEGLDDRVQNLLPLEPLCLTDAVLNSGDSAALAVIEAVSRLVPGFMGKESSGEEESFSDHLLEYPHYTRPEELEGLSVPPILLSGHHEKIASWRRAQSILRTRALRPDLLAQAHLTKSDVDVLCAQKKARVGRNLSFCLVHHPVRIEGRQVGTSSLTNLDIHDIARISASYGLGPFFVLTPLNDQKRLLASILAHWLKDPVRLRHPDRARALEMVQEVSDLEEAVQALSRRTGCRPAVVASSARWPGKGDSPLLTVSDLRERLETTPVLFCLGTAQGLSEAFVRACDGRVRPLRFLGYNHLSVRSAAAIYADRILGDYD